MICKTIKNTYIHHFSISNVFCKCLMHSVQFQSRSACWMNALGFPTNSLELFSLRKPKTFFFFVGLSRRSGLYVLHIFLTFIAKMQWQCHWEPLWTNVEKYAEMIEECSHFIANPFIILTNQNFASSQNMGLVQKLQIQRIFLIMNPFAFKEVRIINSDI